MCGLGSFAGPWRKRRWTRWRPAIRADDQAETVLFRFLRGSGGAGLAGIRPVTAEGLVRPLIECGRAETEAVSARARDRVARGFEQPAPAIRAQPDSARTVAACSSATGIRRCGDAGAYWRIGRGRRRSIGRPRSGGWRADVLREDAGAVLMRVARSARASGGGRTAAGAAGDRAGEGRSARVSNSRMWKRVLDFGIGRRQRAECQAPGLDVLPVVRLGSFCRAGRVLVGEPELRGAGRGPGVPRFPAAQFRWLLELLEKTGNYYRMAITYIIVTVSCLDWRPGVSVPLELRNWRPGDQYRPVGASRAEKIKTLFQSARIPVWERRHWPVLIDGRKSSGRAGLAPAADVAADARSKRILRRERIEIRRAGRVYRIGSRAVGRS